jgi:dienelactone hydrolase
VGFRIIRATDGARAWLGGAPRPVPISVFYPATLGPGARPLPFRTFVETYLGPDTTTILTLADRAAAVQRYRKEALPNASAEAFQALLDAPTFSTDAPLPAAGSFPLVLYAPGFGAHPLHHVPILESLASHGFVVAAVPSRGAEAYGMTFDAEGQEAQRRDLEFVLGRLRHEHFVDATQVGAIGYSFGGGPALLLALQRPVVRAVVSLDGTPAFGHTVGIVRAGHGYDPARIRAAMLAVCSDDDAEMDLSLLRSLRLSPRAILRIRGAEHHDFIAADVIRGAGGPATSRAPVLGLAIGAVRAFLAAHLRTDPVPDGLDALVDASSGLATLERWDAEATPMDPTGLIHLILDSPESEALTRYKEQSRGVAGLPLLSAGQMDLVVRRLREKKRRRDARAMAAMFVELYPGSDRARQVLDELDKPVDP